MEQLIQATFDIFDTEPRTWQLDFDEFCHWLETGERVLNSHGIMQNPTNIGDPTPSKEPPKGKFNWFGGRWFEQPCLVSNAPYRATDVEARKGTDSVRCRRRTGVRAGGCGSSDSTIPSKMERAMLPLNQARSPQSCRCSIFLHACFG